MNLELNAERRIQEWYLQNSPDYLKNKPSSYPEKDCEPLPKKPLGPKPILKAIFYVHGEIIP